MSYQEFLATKTIQHKESGFEVNAGDLNPMLFDWQKELVKWALFKGRAAIFADCGLGKTPMQLEWAQKIVEKNNKRVLVLTPLAVAQQTVKEGEKFGIKCSRSVDGSPAGRITITNYEKLHLFNPADYIGAVCDESSILKNFDGSRKKQITYFLKRLPYRLLCTATAAPNDYIELGTSAEALGVMGHMDMLSRFFKNQQNNCSTKRSWATTGGGPPKWRFKKHAENPFWKWVCSWARALRHPSDVGFADGRFVLPDLIEKETIIPVSRPLPGKLFPEPALNLRDQRLERRETMKDRCEKVAEIVNNNNVAVVWCHLNDEGDLLTSLIPEAKQVKGSMSDDLKESVLADFTDGNVRVLVTKPKIGAFGLNWQHCHHMTFFPSHSYEQYYQGVRRCWRFGQQKPVTVDIVTSQGEVAVLKNLQQKSNAADKMFNKLVGFMNHQLKIESKENHTKVQGVPTWLS